ncbi:MAG TPA: DsbA family protein [Gemmatimonadaceae bacterium]
MEPGRGRRPDVVKGSAKGRSSKPAVRAKSKTPFYAVLGVIAAIAVLLIAWQATRPTSMGVVVIDPNTPLPEAEGYLLGDSAAPVQILEFADFECPACMSFATLTEPDVRRNLVATGKVSFRFLDFPLSMHLNSWDASMAAACANEQGKFWEMHDLIFANQDRWSSMATRRPKGIFANLAESLGLNMGQWNECYDSKKYLNQIAANQREGERRGVRSTPTFVIGSRMIALALSWDSFKMYVDSALAQVDTTRAGNGDRALERQVPPPDGR